MNNYIALEFDKILEKLADNALSEAAKTRCLALAPSLNEVEVKRWMSETTQAKRIIEQIGTPPLSSMSELQKVLKLIDVDAMLTPDQIEHVSSFLVSCRRMKKYLKKAEVTDSIIAWYGGSIDELTGLQNEIERCIRNGTVDDKASFRLGNIRRQIVLTNDQIRAKLDALLRKNKAWFSESFISVRNGRYTLPVKREHKNKVAGTVIELSNTGGTCFIEPSSAGTCRPLCAIRERSPTVLRATVLPPVLGPVITTPLYLSPVSKFKGTADSWGSKGCRALFK